MKLLHVTRSINHGGAGKAALRLHNALLTHTNINSYFYSAIDEIGIPSFVADPFPLSKFTSRLRTKIVKPILSLYQTSNPSLHSISLMPSRLLSFINNSDFDIIHLHWVQGETLSVEDIGKINKPIVWTLHDMWPFCGAEHLSSSMRYVDGYLPSNCPSSERSFDLNRWVWSRKVKEWNSDIKLVAPSRWMAECASKSFLFSQNSISIIPNCLDEDLWLPQSHFSAKTQLGFKEDDQILSFGADFGTKFPHKGFDLLVKSLHEHKLRFDGSRVKILIFGQNKPADYNENLLPYPTTFTGQISDDSLLQTIYSASNLFCLPSRMDNLPNTVIESLACGTPVVAFSICGLPDMIKHGKNGYLAKPFDCVDFSKGIDFLLNSKEIDHRQLARSCFLSKFSENIVTKSFSNLYNQLLFSDESC